MPEQLEKLLQKKVLEIFIEPQKNFVAPKAHTHTHTQL